MKYKILVLVCNLIGIGGIVWLFLGLIIQGSAGYRGTAQEETTFLVLLILVIISIIFSHVDHSHRRIIWAIIPVIAFLLLGGITIVGNIRDAKQSAVWSAEYEKISEERYTEVKNALAPISRDFIKYESEQGTEFITHDTKNNVLVYISFSSNGEGGIRSYGVYPVGVIQGKNLVLAFEDTDKRYSDFKNRDGRTLYDLYTVVYNVNEPINNTVYHLEQYPEPKVGE